MLRIRLWQVIVVVLICAASVLFALPNLFSQKSLGESYPDWLPSQQVNLGLDLQGGSHLLLEVQIEQVLIERIEALVDDVRTALRGERIGYTGLKRRGLKVVLQLTTLENRDAAYDLLSDLDREVQVESDDAGAFELFLTESAVVERKSSALSQSIEIIRRRIDETGISEPTIQRQGEDRILVQLPGLDDPERLKRLLGKTAKMSFHLVDQTVTASDLARGRLPAWAGRIHTGNAIDWMPSQRYDFVRTGLEYVPLRRRGDLMRHLLDHAVAVDGRLVIGSFSEERPDLLVGERLEEQISSWGFVISGRTERPHYEDERLLYKTVWNRRLVLIQA